MSKHNTKSQVFNKTRRNFLKGAAYTSALSIGGLSSYAFAAANCASNTVINETAGYSSCAISRVNGISIIQQTKIDRETVTLINQSGKLQMLDARQPISLEQSNGSLLVSVNQNDSEAVNGMVLMSPNERFTFDVKAIGIDVSDAIDIPALTNLAEHQLQISSEHSVFNRIVPVELV